MQRRIALTAFALIFVALAGAPPVAATALLDESEVTPDSDVTLTLRVTVDQPGEENVRVVATLPEGFDAVGCNTGAGWRCSADPAVAPAPARVAWRRVTPGRDLPEDVFTFAVRTPVTEGSYGIAVTQEYSDGEVVRWDGPAGDAQEAPVLTVAEPAPAAPPQSPPPPDSPPPA